MARYGRAAPKAIVWDTEVESFRPNMEVDDHQPVDTKLLWPDGKPIIRYPNPIGFGRNEEW